MESIILTLLGALGQGVTWGIMVIGIYISFRLLDFADLSVDGSFATGGCVCAICMVNNIHPLLAMLLATIAGLITGLITGLLNTKLLIAPILSGILVQLGLYSVNLRIMGRSNLPLLKVETLFDKFDNLLSLNDSLIVLIIGIIFALIIVILLYCFMKTEIGVCLRATGSNEFMVRSLGVNTDNTKILGLVISNGLVALSGSLVAQTQGSADVKMGIGAIVIGLASIIIGESLFTKKTNFAIRLLCILAGSVIYRVVIAFVLQLGLNTDDLKLFTAILVTLALSSPLFINKFKLKKVKEG